MKLWEGNMWVIIVVTLAVLCALILALRYLANSGEE